MTIKTRLSRFVKLLPKRSILGVLGEGLIKKLQRVAIREEQEIRDDAAIACRG
jgi:hypothetical protein